MKRILAAVDFTDATSVVLDAATAIAQAMKGELNILHATEPAIESIGYRGGPESMGDGIVEVKQDTHELRSICDSLAARGVEARFSEMLGPTVDMILEEAERFDADLIVIGTHEHGQFYHLVFGGVRETLIARSPCPVLVVK